MKTIISLLILSVFFIQTGCVTRLPTPQGVKEISTAEYEKSVLDKTKRTEVYDGLYNKLTVTATRLDADLTEDQLAYSAKLLQWNENVYRDEKAKVISKHSTNTEFFVSFYTPETKHDDLNSTKSSWKIYLDVNGQRYEGTATKIKTLFLDLEVMYPKHTRWATPYSVTFPISTPTTEGKSLILTITGPLATTQLAF